MRSEPLKIALGDLRHGTVGRHSVYMPIGIGYIASYMLAHVDSDNVAVRLCDRPDVMLKSIEQWKPTVIGLSNYCWNTELSCLVFNYAKKVNPNTVCVAGGPEFPTAQRDCKKYLSERKGIDFYVYLEGEIAFANLIKELQAGVKVSELKSNPQDGIMSIHPVSGELVVGGPIPKLKNLDEIPSPYLTGLLEPWFNSHYVPSIETVRGCPFVCGYCHTGQSWYNTLGKFSVNRVKAELTYIARRMAGHTDIPLVIYDNNFGISKRDEIIAEHLRDLQDEIGWPKNFVNDLSAKANRDRILRITSILRNKMHICCSMQSLNPKTLCVIKRKNLPMAEYESIQGKIKQRGMRSVSEFIIPMPEETKTSFFEGIKTVTNAGIEGVFAYTTMLLKGTYLNSQECREKYEMQTKFRLIPKQFGEYVGGKCFEIEEVCVATNTMSFADYLDCRGFTLIFYLLSHKQFDFVHRHLKELKIAKYDYVYYFWKQVRSGKTELSRVYDRYIEDTKAELWDSRAAIYEDFTKQENYQKLLTGEFGNNLLMKYSTELLFEQCILAIELVYFAIKSFVCERTNKKIQESLEAAKCWMIAVRNINGVLQGDLVEQALSLPYDVNNWYLAGGDAEPLTSYNRSVNYRISCEADEIGKILADGKKLFGEEHSFQIGKLLLYWDVSNFWRKCELATE